MIDSGRPPHDALAWQGAPFALGRKGRWACEGRAARAGSLIRAPIKRVSALHKRKLLPGGHPGGVGLRGRSRGAGGAGGRRRRGPGAGGGAAPCCAGRSGGPGGGAKALAPPLTRVSSPNPDRAAPRLPSLSPAARVGTRGPQLVGASRPAPPRSSQAEARAGSAGPTGPGATLLPQTPFLC